MPQLLVVFMLFSRMATGYVASMASTDSFSSYIVESIPPFFSIILYLLHVLCVYVHIHVSFFIWLSTKLRMLSVPFIILSMMIDYFTLAFIWDLRSTLDVLLPAKVTRDLLFLRDGLFLFVLIALNHYCIFVPLHSRFPFLVQIT